MESDGPEMIISENDEKDQKPVVNHIIRYEDNRWIAREVVSQNRDEMNEDRRSNASAENSIKSTLAYTNLSDRVYFWVTILIHVSTLAMALSLDDLNQVFEFIGAIASPFIMLFYPGLTYIVALRKFGNSSHHGLWETIFYHALAWLYIALSFVVVGFYFYITA